MLCSYSLLLVEVRHVHEVAKVTALDHATLGDASAHRLSPWERDASLHHHFVLVLRRHGHNRLEHESAECPVLVSDDARRRDRNQLLGRGRVVHHMAGRCAVLKGLGLDEARLLLQTAETDSWMQEQLVLRLHGGIVRIAYGRNRFVLLNRQLIIGSLLRVCMSMMLRFAGVPVHLLFDHDLVDHVAALDGLVRLPRVPDVDVHHYFLLGGACAMSQQTLLLLL